MQRVPGFELLNRACCLMVAINAYLYFTKTIIVEENSNVQIEIQEIISKRIAAIKTKDVGKAIMMYSNDVIILRNQTCRG
jgi:hypothetical protein